jgi:hypothetical protein
MVITIWVDEQHPVAGRAGVADQPPRSFAGWLQLLSILSDLVERQTPDDPSGDPGRP